MSRGGPRKGAGRKPGAATAKTREAANIIAAAGITPLGYLQGLIEGTQVYDQIKFEAAKAAAPYVHARLASIESRGEIIHRYVARLPAKAKSTEEWQQQHAQPNTIQ